MRKQCCFLLGVGLVAGLAGALVAGDAGKALKYQFKPGSAYIYTISVVGELGAATQTSKGTVQLTGKSGDENQITLKPSTSISTQTKQPPTPGKKSFGPGKMPFGPKGFPRAKFGGGPPEVTIDVFGKLLRTSTEDTQLPLLLGPAEQFVIEPLSSTGDKRWQQERTLFIREGDKDDPKDTKNSAKELATYEITGGSGSLVNIKKTYSLKTPMQEGAARFQFDGVSNLVFDKEAGVMKSGDFKGMIVVSDKNLTFKIPVSASYRLMDPAEAAALKKQQEEARDKAAAAFKEANRPKEVSQEELRDHLASLKSGDKNKVRQAADKFAKAVPVPGMRDEVAQALVDAVPDFTTRHQASNALKVWGTDKAVLPLLQHKDLFVRHEACKILGDIGGSESLPALRAAQADSNGLVASEAKRAVKAVESRK